MTDLIRVLRQTFIGALVVGVFVVFGVTTPKAQAATGINQQLNFQGRLLTSQGATVADGYYNMQFKIYQDGTGTVAGNPSGTLKWTESWLNNEGHGVQVKNGYMSLQLGSITSLAGVDWSQDTLWLSINVGNTNTSCTPFTSCAGDGEMLPMKRLSSTPYAFNAGALNGLTSAQFLQLAQGVQTEAGTNTTSVAINKTGTGGNFLNLQASGVDVFKITNTGDITFGSNIDHAISVGTAATSTAGKALTISAGTAGTGASALTGGTLTLQGGNGGGTNGNGGNLVLDAGAAASGGIGGTVNIGTTNASSINLGQNTTLAGNKSLTITGGSSRPSSPTEGTLYYDTTTKQLITYANGKWQSDRSTSTKIVAASNSTQAEKDAADYVATGTGDQGIINTALTAAAGGKVYLMEGTYTINGSISIPNNTTLAGAGAGTLITVPNTFNTSINAITNTTTGGSGTGIVIQDLQLDGNTSNQTSGTMNGIYLNGVGNSTTLPGAKVTNVQTNNWRYIGIYLTTTYNTSITGNTSNNNKSGGIYINSGSGNTITSNVTNNTSSGVGITSASSSNNSITGNTIANSNGDGIYVYSGSNNTITSNTVTGNTEGFEIYSSTNNAITGNTVSGSTSYGIYLHASANTNTISANNIYNNGGATDNNAVYVSASSYNTISGNTIADSSATTTNYPINIADSGSNSNYLADNTFGSGSINNLGTGTVYANQSRTSNGGQLTNRTANDTQAFTIQNAGGSNIFTVDTTGNQVVLGNSSTAGKLVLNDGANHTGTIQMASASGNYTYSIPAVTANDTFCLVTLNNCAANSALFIQNQNAAAQTTSNFWISGTGRADTSLLTPTVDTGTGVALNIGTTTATGVTIGKSSTVTTVNGKLGITLDTTTGTTITCRNTSGYLSVCDPSVLTPSAANFIQNGTSVQTGANFWIDGYGKIAGGIQTGSIDTISGGGTLNIGTGNAGALTIGKTGVTTTIQGSTKVTPQTSTSTIILCSNSGVISTCDSSVLSPTASNFIQNQASTPGTAQTGNFNITGTGIAATLQATSLLSTTLDTASAGTLTIGGTTATGITLSQNVTVAANKSLTLSGGTTANRPASPTEGMLWYDTTTKQLLTYSNGKWQADRSTSTKIVAASNASQALKDGADYVATGTSDQNIINTALTATAGGKVYLTEGTYTLSGTISVPNNTTLAGSGNGTIITIPNALNATNFYAITNTTTGGNGTGITIQDLKLDGNSSNQTSGSMYGVYFNGVGSGTGSSAIQGGKIANIRSNNWSGGNGISLSSSSNNIVTGNTTQGNNSGIYLSSSSNNSVSGNSVQGNSSSGILLSSSSNNSISGNNTQGNSYGISLSSSSNNSVSGNSVQGNSSSGILLSSSSNTNTITGNTIQGNTTSGIYLSSSSNNAISGNDLYDNGGATANNAIYVNASDSNTITGNNISDSSATSTNYVINIVNSTSDTNYLADNVFTGTSGTPTINDAGTGTVYAGQSASTTSFLLQPASNMTLGNSSTTTTVQGSLSITPQSSTSTTLLCTNGGVLSTCNSSVLAPTASNFIQNATLQQTANFNISGTGIASTLQATSLVGNSLDTISGALTIGGTNATAINLNQNVTVATGKTLTVNGSAFDTTGKLGVGTTTPGRSVDVVTNDSSNSSLPMRITQNGSGDNGIELSTGGQSFYVGTDASDGGAFKIGSSTATGSTSTLGITAVEPNADAGISTTVSFMNFTPSATGTITKVSVYVSNTDTAPNNKGLAGIYNNTFSTRNQPYQRIGASPEQTLTANAWNTFTLTTPISVTAGVIYWFAYAANGSSASYNNPVYATGAPANTSAYITSGYTYSGTLPATITIGGTSGSAVYYSYNGLFQTGAAGDQFAGNLLRITNTGQTSFRNSADTTSAFQVQNAAGTSILNIDTTNSKVLVAGALDTTTATTLSLGTSTATAVTVGRSGITTTIQGTLSVTPQTSTSTTLLCTNSGVVSTCNSSVLSPTAANFIQNQNASAQTTANFWISGTGQAATLTAGTVNATTSLVTPAVDAASATTLTLGGTTASAVSVGKSSGTINLLANSTLVGTSGSTITIQGATQATSNTTGNLFVLQGSTGNGTAAGGQLTLQGGTAGTTSGNGGNVYISGGTATGTGAAGLVVITTPTFSTATADANCYTSSANVASSCTISSASVNGTSAVLVGFTIVGQTATLPDPTITTAGRVIYVTASGTSQDFTLSVNGGGQGNQIAMRKNTTATMIWNGADWTAAGASSSTTLQAAYDNTLQSAGGAELVVSKTSATNGLTIRDSTTNSVNGALLTVQSSSAANLFSVNSNVTEYATDAGAEVYGASTTTFPSSTWNAITSSTVSRYTTAGDYIATGQGSVSIATPATTNSGAINTLSSALTPNMTYNVSFSTRLASGTFTDMTVYYSINGSTQSVQCATGQTAKTSVWTKVNCTFQAPASGITATNAILIQQASGVARTFYVDNLSVTIAADYNYAGDGDVDDSGMTYWSYTTGTGAGTVSRNTGDGYNASSSATVAITTGAANAGLRNKLAINPLTSTLYRVSVYAKAASSFTDFKVRYSPDGGTNYVDCVDYNTQTLTTTGWTQVNCYIKTGATTVSNPYVYFAETASAVRTYYVDAFSMTLSSNTTANVQIGSGSNGGPTTLFTLDKGASAPIAANNDSLLGSMYYDTTLGKLQCYEADGWGACGSSPDNIVTISPEYTNAVMHGTGVGTMTSDFCSSALNINDGTSSQPTICGSGDTYNFYKWTSPQATSQAYSIYVTYQLPTTFKEFTSGQTSLQARVDNTSNASVQMQIYKNHSGLTTCGGSVTITTSANTWLYPTASGTADPSTCGFAGGDSIVFKITLSANSNANAYIGNLNFTFSNK